GVRSPRGPPGGVAEGRAMPDLATLLPRLFSAPGGPADVGLRAQAAAAYAGLLARAGDRADPALCRHLDPIQAFLRGPAPAAIKRRLLCHPLLVEGLHALAPFAPVLRHWHDNVTTPPEPTPAECDTGAWASLGNVALVARLRSDRGWWGEHDCCTDVFGRVGFPLSDWTLTVRTDRGEFLTREAVTLSLGPDRAAWRLAGAGGPFLVMSREACLRMLVDNADPPDPRRVEFPDPSVRPCVQCAARLGRSAVRYDPVGFPPGHAHAGLTGGLVRRLFAAVRGNSPAVYRELRMFIHAVRGFELPPTAHGVVGSFSDPTLPGVISVNVSYTPEGDPCIDPFCFTWLGHELGHTKDYLIDTVLHEGGLALTANPTEPVGPIPRYGRTLPVRTLFQIPYVHLYEWALLMDFRAAGFRGLPWRVPPDAVAEAGEDLAAEIREGFGLIREWARLTPAGAAALSHFRDLYAQATARWRSDTTGGGR
ncbi:MAG TPA: hypothetical protein VKE74_28995, partial [Gemmataceae bacterium]|nr:hypothetical protein [Gemmataceae bacterium]